MTRVALLLLLTLTACTGTVEQGTPIFLVVGYQADPADGAEGKVGLVEDTFGVSGASEDRLSFVTSRDLPAAPVAYDLTHRANLRDTLVVLSRNDGSVNVADSAAFLSFFNLEGIDPTDPVSFTTARETLALSILTAEPNVPIGTEFCPVDVQVSSDGRYAALLHDGAPCGGPEFQAVDVIDTEVSPPALLERFDVQIEPASLYLAQTSTGEVNDRLYFFEDDPAGVQLTEVTLPDENANNPDIDTAPDGDVEEVIDIPDNNEVVVDLGVAPTDANLEQLALVALFDESFVPVVNYAEGTPNNGARVETIDESRKLITDDFLTTESVFVLGEDEFTVHQNITEGEEEGVSVDAVDAVYEPRNNFVFFVSEQLIRIFDPTSFTFGEDDDIDIDSLPAITELTAPAFITWAQAVGGAPNEE